MVVGSSDLPPDGRALRASDADREETIAALREHFSAGRLSDEDLAERTTVAYEAKLVAQLDALTLDLPPRKAEVETRSPPRSAPARRPGAKIASVHSRGVRVHGATYVLVNLLLVAIWATTGGGSFWPIWPMLGWGVGLGSHAAGAVGTRRAPGALSGPGGIGELEARARSERPHLGPAAAPHGTVTILFSDIERSTQLNEQLGDVRWLELLRKHHEIVRAAIRAHGAFEVKVQGDGFMIAMPSARRAAQCALAIQAAMQAEHTDGLVRVRIGMHTGEVVREDDDFYGRNVAMAARIAEQATAGEVLASGVVKQIAEGGEVRFTNARVVELKGLGEQVVYTVVAD